MLPLSETFPQLITYLPNQYLRAVVIFIAAIILLRFGFTIIQRALLRFTKSTKTEVDDQIIERSATPLTLIALILSFRITIPELMLTETLAANIIKASYTALVIVIGYLIYVIIDVALLEAWKILSKKTKVKIDDSLTSLAHGTLKIILIILAFLYILDLWEVEILPLLGALGIAGLAVALALQPTLANIFSGIAMIVDKSVRVGDWIILEDGMWGVVEKIGIRSTKFRTFDNELIVLPNTKFADSRIQNVSMPDPKARIVIPFSVAYGTDVDKVKKLIISEIKKIPRVVDKEEIVVRFLEMGESSLNFKAYFYIESFEFRMASIDEATTRIYNALNKAGIEIPFPQMDVHFKKK